MPSYHHVDYNYAQGRQRHGDEDDRSKKDDDDSDGDDYDERKNRITLDWRDYLACLHRSPRDGSPADATAHRCHPGDARDSETIVAGPSLKTRKKEKRRPAARAASSQSRCRRGTPRTGLEPARPRAGISRAPVGGVLAPRPEPAPRWDGDRAGDIPL